LGLKGTTEQAAEKFICLIGWCEKPQGLKAQVLYSRFFGTTELVL